MDRTLRLDARREAALQRVADDFVAKHRGDVMKALKEMIVLNGELQERLEKQDGVDRRIIRATLN